MFFIRGQNSPKEAITDVRGSGHCFPEAYTTWDASGRGSETHQRIIRYGLVELNIAIWFEADDCIAKKELYPRENHSSSKPELDEDSLVSALAKSKINVNAHSSSGSLRLTRDSGSVPQSAIFDLKTRTIKKKYHEQCQISFLVFGSDKFHRSSSGST